MKLLILLKYARYKLLTVLFIILLSLMMKHLIIFSHSPFVFLSSLINALQIDKLIKIYLSTLTQS